MSSPLGVASDKSAAAHWLSQRALGPSRSELPVPAVARNSEMSLKYKALSLLRPRHHTAAHCTQAPAMPPVAFRSKRGNCDMSCQWPQANETQTTPSYLSLDDAMVQMHLSEAAHRHSSETDICSQHKLWSPSAFISSKSAKTYRQLLMTRSLRVMKSILQGGKSRMIEYTHTFCMYTSRSKSKIVPGK